MSFKRRNMSFDREKKIHKVKKDKTVIEKHKKLIYNIISSKEVVEDDELDYELNYASVDNKTKR
jgi:hypothetical protein